MAQPQSLRGVDLVPLIIRIALAIVFIYHGYGKVFQGGHAFITSIMAMKGAPFPGLLGWVAGCTEFFGGIALLIGLLSRIAALGLGCVMYVAIAIVHWPNGFDLRNEGTGYEYCLVLLLAALAIFLGGPGGISLDRLFFARRKKQKSK